MSFIGVYYWTLFLAYSAMIVIEVITLVKVLCGKRYKVLMAICVMLIGSNIAYLVYNSEYYVYWNEGQQNKSRGATIGTSGPIGDLLFGEAHWVLAIYYLKIATNMPLIIDGQEDQVKDFKVLMWVGILCNAIFPIGEGITYNIQMLAPDYGGLLNSIFVQITQFFTYVSWIVSGCIVIWSIWRIKRFLYSLQDDGSELNIGQLWLHATIFGLFLVSVIIYEVCYSAWVVSNLLSAKWSTKAVDVYFGAWYLLVVCSFVS